jgi:hypothetical protein
MTTTEIITALNECTFPELEQIRAALDARASELKADFMAQAQAMGLSCSDGNGKPRKRRSKQHEPD